LIEIRPATINDAQLLLDWRNDPITRQNAFNSEPISLETHTEWLSRKLNAADTVIWILEENGQPVAQIRYDQAEISIVVAPEARGKGHGSTLLMISAPLACRRFSVPSVFGLVKKNNVASCRAFEKSGFTRTELDACFKYEWALPK
jgi:RimJ/RimL family protein N-acetyltransferase